MMVTGREGGVLKYLVYCMLHYLCWYCQDLAVCCCCREREREYWMVVVGCLFVCVCVCK
jgi:hypothetical protein